MPKPVIHGIKSVAEFREILSKNEGKIVIKLGADWCGPCKMIEPAVNHYFSRLPNHVQAYMVDVDESIELYRLLTVKKVIHGIPALLCYNAGNMEIYPDELHIGADLKKLEVFFNAVVFE